MEEKIAELVSQIQQDSQASRNYRAVGYHYTNKKSSYPKECRFLGFTSPSSANLESFPAEVTFCLEENCSGYSIIRENAVSQMASANLLCNKLATTFQPVVQILKAKKKLEEDESEFLGYNFHLQDIQELFPDKIDFNIIPKKKTNGMFIEIVNTSSNTRKSTTPSSENNSDDSSCNDSDSDESYNSSKTSDDSNSDDELNDVDMVDEHVSEYERIRLENIKERKEFLIKMGLVNERKKSQKKVIKVKITKSNVVSRTVHPTRRSVRLSNGNMELFSLPYDGASGNEEDQVKKVNVKRPNSYGQIKGVDIGEWWATRLECNAAGIHRPTVAGIHPGPRGAYSVVLSGGYDDDVDNGESFTYTGSGGRDLKGTKNNPKNLRTAPQSKNQTLNQGNAALVYSCEHKKPVRVVRGYKLKSDYAPDEGYRYDGLYQIEKWWLSEGVSGFLTYKFLFKRCEDQDPPPWRETELQDTSMQETEE